MLRAGNRRSPTQRTDRPDGRVTRTHVLVHPDAAALPERQACINRQARLRLDTHQQHHHVALNARAGGGGDRQPLAGLGVGARERAAAASTGARCVSDGVR